MIVKSRAQLRRLADPDLGSIELEESCSLCDVMVPEGAVVLRHTESNHIICVPCLGWIAMLSPDDEIVDDRT